MLLPERVSKNQAVPYCGRSTNQLLGGEHLVDRQARVKCCQAAGEPTKLSRLLAMLVRGQSRGTKVSRPAGPQDLASLGRSTSSGRNRGLAALRISDVAWLDTAIGLEARSSGSRSDSAVRPASTLDGERRRPGIETARSLVVERANRPCGGHGLTSLGNLSSLADAICQHKMTEAKDDYLTCDS